MCRQWNAERQRSHYHATAETFNVRFGTRSASRDVTEELMAILAIGGTGQIGSHVVEELARRGAEVRAFGSEPSPRGAPAGVEEVIGDIFDIELMRRLLREASTVFVLNPAVADELARVLLTLSLIDEAKIQRVVYLSMMGVDRFTDASRAAAKLAAEQTIRQLGLPPRS